MSVAALGTKLSVWTALDQRGFDWNLTAQWEVGFDDSQSLMFWDRTRAEYSLCRLHSISLCILPLISQPFDNDTLLAGSAIHVPRPATPRRSDR
jgi:hypothetical protein